MDIGRFMNSIADFYDEICTPCSNERVSFLHDFIVKYLFKGSVILDEACSTGETLTNLNLSDSYKLIGMDLSTGMIRKCIEKTLGSGINFIVDDMRYLNHLEGKVDLLYNNSIAWLSHVDEIEKTFRRAYDVLNTGGWMIVDTNNSETFYKGQNILCTSSVITDTYELYKTTRFHDLKKDYLATQIYTKYNYKDDIIDSYASQLHFLICDKESICGLIEKAGFKLKQILGDYKPDGIESAAYLQFICEK